MGENTEKYVFKQQTQKQNLGSKLRADPLRV